MRACGWEHCAAFFVSAHTNLLWKLGYIVCFVICYKFARFKLHVFSLIVSFQSKRTSFKLDYYTVLKTKLHSCMAFWKNDNTPGCTKHLLHGVTYKRNTPITPWKIIKCLRFHPFCHFFHWFFKYLLTSVIIVPRRLMWFMGDWEWDSFQCDHCGAGFDQKTVMQPEATETAGMTQPPEEKNVNPTQTTATTKKIVNQCVRRCRTFHWCSAHN